MAEKTLLKVIFPNYDESKGQIQLTLEDIGENSPTKGETFFLNVNSRTYNENSKADNKWERTAESVEHAFATLRGLGEATRDENGEDRGDEEAYVDLLDEKGGLEDEDALFDMFFETVFELYATVQKDDYIASLKELPTFIENAKITSEIAYDLQDGALKDEVFESVGGFRHWKGHQLQLSIRVPVLDESGERVLNDDGEQEYNIHKISQLARKPRKRGEDEVIVKLNYETKKIRDTVENAKNSERMPDAAKEKLFASLERHRESAFRDKVEEIENVFGWDIEEMLESHEDIHVTVKVQKTELDNKIYYWLIGKVEESDIKKSDK